jgi:hypothetical protein
MSTESHEQRRLRIGDTHGGHHFLKEPFTIKTSERKATFGGLGVERARSGASALCVAIARQRDDRILRQGDAALTDRREFAATG